MDFSARDSPPGDPARPPKMCFTVDDGPPNCFSSTAACEKMRADYDRPTTSQCVAR